MDTLSQDVMYQSLCNDSVKVIVYGCDNKDGSGILFVAATTGINDKPYACETTHFRFEEDNAQPN